MVFDSNRLGFDPAGGLDRTEHALYEKQSDGAGTERLLLAPEPGYGLWAFDGSRDGLLVFAKSNLRTNVRDLWILPLVGERKPFPYLTTSFDEADASVSPDGRWLAYTSNEFGIHQVIVQPFPDPSGGKWQISTAGGILPRWKRDGTELYYLDRAGYIIAVPLKTNANFEVGKALPLFKTSQSPLAGGSALDYAVTSDGQRFLVLSPGRAADTSPIPITVLVNWTSALTR